jgi:hypothetical protein
MASWPNSRALTILADLARPRLDHHDRVAAAGHHQIQLALAALLVGRVHDELAVHDPDAHRGDRPLERDLRDRQRGRRPGDRQHVRVVRVVGRQHQRDDLRFVPPARREQRPDRTVDQAAGEDFLLGRLALALEEPAGNAPRRVGRLAVVHGQRQEVDARTLARRVAGRRQDDRVPVADRDGAVGLLGQLAGLDGEHLPADLDLTCMHGGSRASILR